MGRRRAAEGDRHPQPLQEEDPLRTARLPPPPNAAVPPRVGPLLRQPQRGVAAADRRELQPLEDQLRLLHLRL